MYQQLQEKSVKITALTTTIDKLETDISQLNTKLKESGTRLTDTQEEVKTVSFEVVAWQCMMIRYF